MVYGGGIRRAQDVVLFNAVMYNPHYVNNPAKEIVDTFGEILDQTAVMGFDHTDYYKKEFGNELKKFFLAHRIKYQPDRLVEFKLRAIQLEDRFKVDGKRKLNVDPGYIAIEKVVAASTKNFTHRIYLGKGIYADLQLIRKENRYEALPWTFYDYSMEAVVSFFDKVRKELMGDNI